MQLICTASNTGFLMIGTVTSMGTFFLSGGFSLTGTGDLWDSSERERTNFYSSLPLPPNFTNIERYICIYFYLHLRYALCILNCSACNYHTVTQ